MMMNFHGGRREVQRAAHQVADHLLQRGAVAGGGKATLEMEIEVEVGVVFPIGAQEGHGRPDDALTKAVVAQPAIAQHLPDAIDVEWMIEGDDGVDHHQVGRLLHAEPGGIHGGHDLDFGHVLLHLRA